VSGNWGAFLGNFGNGSESLIRVLRVEIGEKMEYFLYKKISID
jgi:hypothetical protein